MSDTAPTEVLTIDRTFNAPADAVYDAWLNPEIFVAWYGPEGIYVPAESLSIDPTVGGTWSFEMRSHDNPDMIMPNSGTLTALEPGKVLEWSEAVAAMPGVIDACTIVTRVELTDVGDGTTAMHLTQTPSSKVMVEHASVGWMSSFTKLDKVLGT